MMCSRFSLPILSLSLLIFSGCGDDHEQVWKDHVQCLSDIHTTLVSVTDEATAQAAATQLNAALDQLDQIKQRAEQLDPISKTDNEALEKKYKPQIDEVAAHIRTRLETVLENPQVEKHLKAARERMAKLAGVVEMPAKQRKPEAEKEAGASAEPKEPKLPGLE